jgi:hypothetical protein
MNAALPINVQVGSCPPAPIRPGTADGIQVLLRVEAATELTLAVMAYHSIGGTWLLFAALFLVPDISMVFYLVNPRIGAAVYNGGHTYIAPALLALSGVTLALPVLYKLALIWAAHIGFDRLLGYGLKYKTQFGATHLGWKGRPKAASDLEPGV